MYLLILSLVALMMIIPGLNGEAPGRRQIFKSFRGSTPKMDGVIRAGEWNDAFTFSSALNWVSEFAPVTNSRDLSLQGFIKHDDRHLYFGFRVLDDLRYASSDTAGRWVPPGNPNATELTQQGWPWFGDELEILIDATGRGGNDSVAGNASEWQMVFNSGKSRLGGIGVPGLCEGEPRSSDDAWQTYRRWIETGAMTAAASLSNDPGNRGYQVEWAVAFELLEIGPSGRVYNSTLADTRVGFNLAVGDVDTRAVGDKNFGLHHEQWPCGTKQGRTHKGEFCDLVLCQNRCEGHASQAANGTSNADSWASGSSSTAGPSGGMLQSLVQQSIESGDQYVKAPPGIYPTHPTLDPHVHLLIEGARDLVIDMYGTTLLATNLTLAINFRNCSNVTLLGLVVDYHPLPFTQGRVVAAGSLNESVDIKIDPGYPEVLLSRVRFVDNVTHREKDGTNFPWGAKASWQSPPPSSIVRISEAGIGNNVFPGDLAFFSGGPAPGMAPHGITVADNPNALLDARSINITIRDVTVHAAPGMAFVADGHRGGLVLDGVRVIPGPPPTPNSPPRLTSSSWDAILHGSCRGIGPITNNCSVVGAGDDSWSVQPHDYLVLQSTRMTTTAAAQTSANESWSMVIASRISYKGLLFPGDTLTPGLNGPVAVVVTASQPIKLADAHLDPSVVQRVLDAKPYTQWAVGGANARVLKISISIEAGPSSNAWRQQAAMGRAIYSPTWQCAGFRLTNTHVDSSGRILIKSGPGVVADNTLISAKGVVVDPEIPPGGAAGVRDLRIERNRIVLGGGHEDMPYSAAAGSVFVGAGESFGAAGNFRNLSGVYLLVFANITIANNVFDACHGPNMVLASATNVSVSGNEFLHSFTNRLTTSGAKYGVNPTSLIYLTEVDSVNFLNNTVGNAMTGKPGPTATACVTLGPGVQSVTGLPGEAGSQMWCRVNQTDVNVHHAVDG